MKTTIVGSVGLLFFVASCCDCPKCPDTGAGGDGGADMALEASPEAGPDLAPVPDRMLPDAPYAGPWKTLTSMPAGGAWPAVGVIGSSIHVVPSNSTSHQIYDTAGAGAWTTGTAVPRAAHYRAGEVVDGKFYLLGGGSPGAIESVGWNYVYDPTSKAWSTKKTMTTARGYVTSAVSSGEIFVIGGPNISGKTLNRTIEAYDPKKDSWRSGTLLPSGTMWPLYSAIGVVGGKIYKLGGGIWTKPFDTAYAYDVSGDKWTALKSVPQKNHGPAGAVLGGKVYVIGGMVELLVTDKVWIYDPAKDSYAAGPALPLKVAYSKAVTVGKCIYLIGGHDSMNKDRTAKLFLKYCP